MDRHLGCGSKTGISARKRNMYVHNFCILLAMFLSVICGIPGQFPHLNKLSFFLQQLANVDTKFRHRRHFLSFAPFLYLTHITILVIFTTVVTLCHGGMFHLQFSWLYVPHTYSLHPVPNTRSFVPPTGIIIYSPLSSSIIPNDHFWSFPCFFNISGINYDARSITCIVFRTRYVPYHILYNSGY